MFSKNRFPCIWHRARLPILLSVVVLLMANLNAMVDAVLHPAIPYFDEEHLVVGGVTGLATALLIWLLGVYIGRLQKTITERIKMEVERERLVTDLQKALAEIKVLRGMLPICASCKKIKDEAGNWTQMEVYIRDHSEADFSHGICPECAQRYYPELYETKDQPEPRGRHSCLL